VRQRPPKPPPPPPPPEKPPPDDPPEDDQLELEDELDDDPGRDTGVAARRPIDDDASDSEREVTASNSASWDATSTAPAARMTFTHSRSMPNSTA
jgi:hypothetical protein